ncbi:SAM-dependent methyltransferase [Nocardia macrotermitis]|uniref:SAM-dependent methyltransferase n=1 Tax=Nocardia macrotermitis TaxID=2585198 RepID=UPI0029E81BED|nr:SAM-dependent methyltransferase [Nocardia macrotermitis]
MSDSSGGVDLRQDVAHSARIYDHFLGGKDNYAADRAAAEKIEQAIPSVRAVARGNREFMVRAVRHLAAGEGVRQFLDIGTGIPTEPNLHQVAQDSAPDARVVYVDNDPIVLAHARALLTGTAEGRTHYVEADVTAPERILSAAGVRETLDFDQPIALSLIALCHFVPGDRIYDIIDTLLAPLASGSYLVMTHLTKDFDEQMVEGAVQAYTRSGIAMEARGYDGVARFFRNLDLLAPGVVAIEDWHPNGIEPEPDPQVPRLQTNATKPPAAGYAAVGRKR